MEFINVYWKEVLSIIAVWIAIYSYVTYIASTLSWKTEPHIFSWGIWAMTTGIAFSAQLAGWWGWWSAQNGVTFLVCIFIALLALKYGKKNSLTKYDWWSLVLSILAIFLWFYTNNPFYGTLFATLADLIGYIPTLIKVWKKPQSEPSSYYLLMNLKHWLSLLALSAYNPTTVIFSGAVIIMNFILISLQIIRKE